MNISPLASEGSDFGVHHHATASCCFHPGEGRAQNCAKGLPGFRVEEIGALPQGFSRQNKLSEGAFDLILDVGRPGFDDAFAAYLRRFVNVNDYMVATYDRDRNAPPKVVMASSEDLSTLYRAVFYKRDPNRKIILDNAIDGVILLFRRFHKDKTFAAYRHSIFECSGILDKISTAYWFGDVCYYVNFYRMYGENPFSDEDHRKIVEISDLTSNLIARHFGRGDAQVAEATALTQGNLEKIVRGLSPQSPLTGREAQVCTLILLGCSSEAIALRLEIAVSSVLTYRRRAYERLGIVSQNELFAKVLAQISMPFPG